MTTQLNQAAQELLDRMDCDMENLRREQAARKKIEPLATRISRAFRRFPQAGLGPPTRLHVSPEIYAQLPEYLIDRPVSGNILFRGCPVTEIPDLDGFRWVRERKNTCEYSNDDSTTWKHVNRPPVRTARTVRVLDALR